MKSRKITAVILLLFTLISLAGCNVAAYEANFTDVFDTFVQVYAYAESKIEFSEAVNEGIQLLNEYHRLYDIYNDYDGINNIKTINDNAGISPVEVDGKIIDLLKFCKEAYYLTDGNVNVAMGSVLKLWHDKREESQTDVYAGIPAMDELISASGHTDIESIIIDEENSTVFISDPLCRIDVGAVAKGYATEKTADFLIKKGLDGGFISVGGNVKILGEKKNDRIKGWKVGIQNPDQAASGPVNVVLMEYGSMATSGDYQRYFIYDGEKYHHIIDKDTLMPTEGMKSVSIWVEDSGMADVLSTYFFTVSYEEAMDFISENPHLDIRACWIDENNKIVYTDSMKGHLQKK